MSNMIHSKYGYETREATRTFSRLEKWLTDKKKQERLERTKGKETKHETNG
ncbi:hypothetical protein [Latilactobacillus curvatus]|uniref:hypothetical protein n=1 Tax=Latilactobacillus curvatus TaxID=28038 RepID=UPI0013E32152|nr:hypothetical protein [Latilactobacillus curvatus]